MNQAVYGKLVAVAKARSLISYADLGKVADLDVSHLPDLDALVKLLEEIALYELRESRPMLVIVVSRKDINMPAKGLFDFARNHGLHKGRDDVAFYTKELNRVYDFWASH